MALVSSSISSLLLQSSLSSSPSFCQVCDLRFSRRSFVSGVAAAAGTVAWPGSIAAVASSPVALAGRVMAANVGDRQAAILATRRGMQLFSKGDVRGSVVEFDKALELDPQQKPYLWQRGLSLYYLRRFEEGAKQFRDDVAVNPNDTEESIWCFLCEAQLYGPDKAHQNFLQLLAVGARDAHDFFYSHLYVGLFHEAHNNTTAAREAITAAVASPYGARSGDYMATLAKVHCGCREWQVPGALSVTV
ncbi:hypothetical protein CY35_08G021500 [Sphagnum magellanicum]|nr:hypothetical protein CY35_08G021500 [Sphagnum magellanicum]KAH9553627.1 hypothetical protein CY35_08G021500 [Sphagnum magellanicum]